MQWIVWSFRLLRACQKRTKLADGQVQAIQPTKRFSSRLAGKVAPDYTVGNCRNQLTIASPPSGDRMPPHRPCIATASRRAILDAKAVLRKLTNQKLPFPCGGYRRVPYQSPGHPVYSLRRLSLRRNPRENPCPRQGRKGMGIVEVAVFQVLLGKSTSSSLATHLGPASPAIPPKCSPQTTDSFFLRRNLAGTFPNSAVRCALSRERSIATRDSHAHAHAH